MKNSVRADEELRSEVKRLRRRVTELEANDRERGLAEGQLRQLEHDLRERVKELNCLYGISKLRDQPDISWSQLLQGIVELIPQAWQYPDATCARIVLPDCEFRTSGFKETPWKQTASIAVHGEKAGAVEVYYLTEQPARDEGPFLKEERNLLEAVTERIERILAHSHAEEQARQQREQLVQLDKMAALGTLVSGVAHEINNPNNFIMLNAPVLAEACKSIMPILDHYYRENGDFLVGGLSYVEMRENIPLLFSGILEGAKRIRNIVDGLKGFARVDSPDLTQQVDVNTVVRSALTLLDNNIKKSTKRFSAELARDLPPLKGNFHRLEQVVVNLVQNACEALQDKQKGILVKTAYDPKTRQVIVSVVDEGVGIPAEHMPYVLDPFFTTKRQSGGTGLGLSVSSGIVKDHGGTLSFASTVGKGTTVTLRLPIGENDNGGKEASK